MFKSGAHDDRRGTCQLSHLRIANPIRCGYDDLISGVYQGQDGVAHTLLATRPDDHLASGVVEMVLFLKLVDDGLAQIHISRNWRILREVVVDSFLSSLLDMIRRVEIGFTDAHVNHVDTLCLHLITLLRHSQRGRWSQAVESI